MGLVVAMACVTWRGPVSMQPKTSSMAIVRAQIGFTEAKVWNLTIHQFCLTKGAGAAGR